MSKRIALFPGSFDPFTKGHEDIVRRGSLLFDEVIVGVGHNTSKKRNFDIHLMKAKIESAFVDVSNVRVEIYEKLTAEFAEDIEANFLLRGLRNTTDFEYENTIAQANKHLNPNLETVLLITTPSLAHISSTIVRELHKFGKDISEFVPYQL
jgi:pantetheine-phosphate adenylyltransferase